MGELYLDVGQYFQAQILALIVESTTLVLNFSCIGTIIPVSTHDSARFLCICR